MQEILKNETEEKVYSTLDKLNIKKSKIIKFMNEYGIYSQFMSCLKFLIGTTILKNNEG